MPLEFCSSCLVYLFVTLVVFVIYSHDVQRYRSKIGDDDDPAPRALVRVATHVNDKAAASKGSTVSKQKSRSRGSGNLGNDAGGGGHGRGSSNDSTSSSPPKSVMEDGTSSSGPVVVPKLGEAVKMPVRSRPQVSASSKPTGTATG